MSNNHENSPKDTQLTSAIDYSTKRLIFGDPVSSSIQSANGPAINYKRINIMTKNPDGSVGDLILKTPKKCFSFGVSENTSMETQTVNGWSFPICLHTQNGPTREETEWVKTFQEIVEVCKDHVMDNKEELDQFDLVRAQLGKIASCLYIKKERYIDPATKKPKEKIADNAIPTLYAKLIYSKKNEKFVTKFYDGNDNETDPLSLLGKYCYADCAIKLESIFIGSKISLQVKLYECNFELASTGMKRLLERPKADTRVLSQTPQNASTPLKEDEDDDDGNLSDGSLVGSDLDESPPSNTPPPKKVIRKIKKVTK
jgi:hypothetical protein